MSPTIEVRPCPVCAQATLVEAGEAVTVVVDAVAISSRAELLAMLEGRETYLRGEASFTRRAGAERGLAPAAPGALFAEHLCSRFPLDELGPCLGLVSAA